MPGVQPMARTQMLDHQDSLFDDTKVQSFAGIPARTSLETDFPIEVASLLAEKESWRKEIHRPATHAHKWWAQRLGTVFRAILTAAVVPDRAEAERALGAPTRLEDLVVFDPFAGSGTTLVEAAKLGARVIGRDINPVASLVQRQALADWDFADLEAAFKQVEAECRDEIMSLFRSGTGETALYYFWVAVAECPECSDDVELFSDYVFAKNAYPRRVPQAHAVCPHCRGIVSVDLSTDSQIGCPHCWRATGFEGPVTGQWMVCSRGHRSRVVDALGGERPDYRMYAKLVASERGEKRYDRADDHDLELFAHASDLWHRHRESLPQPVGALAEGYNTRQALRWGFARWADFFNDRQLYCLGLIAQGVRGVTAGAAEREALAALFSGVLEFNNLFSSYKGEGTGAVRHMFSHHILKPERTPLEANPWGTPLSSGSFSTLFDRRLRRAHDYKQHPHDLRFEDGEIRRVFGISLPITAEIATTYDDFERTEKSAYLSAGDSSDTDLADRSVDLVVTDPPFMDNVHYSELADFFHAWLRGIEPFDGYPTADTTRSPSEVQSTEPEGFGQAIGRVWAECARVLKDDGILAFTFHQARAVGWVELMRALRDAGFVVTALQPVKAEMSVSTTKYAAAAPSNLDSIVVCRKREWARAFAQSPDQAADLAIDRLRRVQAAGIQIGRTDVTSVVGGAVLSFITATAGDTDAAGILAAAEAAAERACSVLSPEG